MHLGALPTELPGSHVSAMFLLRFNGTTFNSICNCLIAGKGYRRVRVRVRAGIKGSFSA